MSFTKKLLVSTVEISQMKGFKGGFLIELLHFSIKRDCLLFWHGGQPLTCEENPSPALKKTLMFYDYGLESGEIFRF